MRYIDISIVLIAVLYILKEATKNPQNIEFKSNINRGIPRCKNSQTVWVESRDYLVLHLIPCFLRCFIDSCKRKRFTGTLSVFFVFIKTFAQMNTNFLRTQLLLLAFAWFYSHQVVITINILICYIWIYGKLVQVQISWYRFRFFNMLIIYVVLLFNQIMFFVFFWISCDCGDDCKYGETAAKNSCNLWFDIWMLPVSFLKFQSTFQINFHRKICISIININIRNMFKVFLLLI